MEHPVPFVVGAARSGTTLLRAMLDAHPALAVPGESHFIPRMRSMRAPVDVDAYIAMLRRERYVAAWGLPLEDLRASMIAANPVTPADAIRRTFLAYAHRHGKSRWGDKTPSYVLHMPGIASMFPEARFVHVVRDGRDVASSMLKIGWARSVEDAALRWAFRVRRGARDGAVLGPQRYREFRYEDLVANPEAVLASLAPFLGLDYDAAMAEPHRRADAVLATVTNPQNHQGLRDAPSRLRDWRTDMSAGEVRRFEAVAGRVLDDLGYERGAPRRAPASLRVATRTRVAASLPHRMASRWRRTVTPR